MRIQLWVANVDTDEVLEEIGTCITDNPSRAVQMYNQDEAWIEKGYNADVRWKDITNPNAAALGHLGGIVKTTAKSAASAVNGKKGGRPRKETKEKMNQQFKYTGTAIGNFDFTGTEAEYKKMLADLRESAPEFTGEITRGRVHVGPGKRDFADGLLYDGEEIAQEI